MQLVLRRAAQGTGVERLQRMLAAAGFKLGAIDGRFGPATEAALIAFQRSRGLLADGVAGPLTWASLEGRPPPSPADVTGQVTIDLVADMFPFTQLDAIASNLPHLLRGLRRHALVDKPMVLMALSTVRAEAEGFEPVDELPSRLNTSPGGHAFDLYDNRIDLGNCGRPDGARFRGRGFVQLTGRDSYASMGRMIGRAADLELRPELANEPALASDILAALLAARRQAIKQALVESDLVRARRLVNGGRHGLDRFAAAYAIGERRLADEVWLPKPRDADSTYAPALVA